MLQRDFVVYGGTPDKTGAPGAASAATPKDIDPIGAPSIHLLSGGTGVGKSVTARNMVEAYGEAHKKAKTNPQPDLLLFTGSGGDPVWADLKEGDRVKKYSQNTEQAFIDEVNRRYDKAMREKDLPKPKNFGRPKGQETKEDAMRAVMGTAAPPGDRPHRPTMVVIDDSASSGLLPSMIARSPIAQAIQSHRHGDMSFIISSQRYHGHNPWLRANATTATVYPPKGKDEINFLKREIPIPHASLDRGFAVAQANGPHNFVHIDIKNRKATHGFTGQEI